MNMRVSERRRGRRAGGIAAGSTGPQAEPRDRSAIVSASRNGSSRTEAAGGQHDAESMPETAPACNAGKRGTPRPSLGSGGNVAGPVALTVVNRLAIAVVLVTACGDNSDGTDESRQGGDTTVDDRTFEAFSHPAANLTADQQNQFRDGRSPFNFRWPIPLLGPLFNADACLDCHGGNGRGLSQIGNGALQSQALIRVSLID